MHAQYRFGMSKLRIFRERAGLSQAELAKKIGGRQPHISEYELGVRAIPLDKAIEAAIVLQCPLTELYPGLVKANSIDVLLMGAPEAIKKEVREYALFRLGKKSG